MTETPKAETPAVVNPPPANEPTALKPPKEYGGPQGPEPTRFGDWERNGRCSDF